MMSFFGRVFYGWWIVAASGGVVLVANGTLWYGFSVLFDPIIHEFGWSTVATAAAFSLRSEVAAFGAPLTGWLADRFGSRRVMVGGVLVTAVGFIMFSQVDSLLTFYLAFSIIAIAATATGNQVGMVAVSWWFVRKRSRALAGLTVGAGLSGLTVPLFAHLVTTQGWRVALLEWSMVIVLVCVPLCLVVRDKPELYGQLPDGDRAPAATLRPAAGAARPAVTVQREASITARQALKNRTFWFLALGMLMHALGSNPAVALLVPALSLAGVNPAVAALALAAVPIASLPGRVAAGWLGDVHDKRLLLCGCLVLEGLGILLLAFTNDPVMLAPFLILFAPAFGGVIPLRPALQVQYFGLHSMGAIQGLMNTIVTIGGFIGPLLVGVLVDITGSYTIGFVAVGVCTLLGAPFFLGIPRHSPPGGQNSRVALALS